MAREGIQAAPAPRGPTPHGARWAPFRVLMDNRLEVTLVSVYGYPSEGPGEANTALVQEIAAYLAGIGAALWAVGGDWNLTIGALWQAGGEAMRGTPWVPREPTC